MFWSTNPDVVVVGAGLAGLRTATRLHKAGLKVTVVEARDRVGGRTFTIKTRNGHTLDMGANWIGPTQDNMYALVKEFGLKLQTQYDEGKHLLDLAGDITEYTGNISDLTVFGRPPELDAVIEKLDRMAVGVDVDSLASVPDMQRKDHTSYETWIDQNVKSDGAKNLLKWFVHVCAASEPSELSLLYMLMFLNQGGSYAQLANIRGGAQQETIIGGSQQVSDRLAASLPSGTIKLSSPVWKIAQTDAGARVHLHSGSVISAKYVVVTIPTSLAGRITYEPPMPPLRDQLTQRMPMGCVIKVILIYREPWWRAAGFSGEALTDGVPLSLMYDKTSHDGHCPALVGFIAGANARQWTERPLAARQLAIRTQLQRLYPKHPAALEWIDYYEHDWTKEEFSRGCYMNVMAPGVMSECGEWLRRPVGRIHWAGSETARKWMAYMEGAVESGNRVSDEILARLNADGKSKM